MADIFLSYAREDRAKAEQIAKALIAGGYEVFWDVEIPPGTSWADFLAEKLANSKAAIVLWSATSTASQWVREEARLARDKGKLIPVMIDNSAPPFGFGEIQAADLSSWNGEADHANWKLLLAGIARAVGSAPTGTAKAPPIRPAATGGWDSARAGGATTEPEKKKSSLPLLIGGGVVAVVALFGVIGAMNGGGGGDAPAGPGSAYVSFSPEVQKAVAAAQEAAQAANAAMAQGASSARAGQQAAAAGQNNAGGYSVSQGPMGMMAGDLAGVQSGRVAPVGIAMVQGTQFFGTMHVNDPSGASYALDGSAVMAGGVQVSGNWDYAGANYTFVGGGSFPNKWTMQVRETGANGSANGVGQVRYANGESYVGEYRAVGEGAQVQLFRNGYGVHYDAKGAVLNAGRFNNDAFAG